MSRSPRRQRERVVDLVVEDPHAREALPDVLAVALAAMVVVPLERGALGLAVLHQLIGVRALLAGLDQQVVAGLGRRQSRRRRSRSRPARVMPPGWPSSPERLCPPWRWTVSRPRLRQVVAKVTLVRRPTGGGSWARGRCRRRSTSWSRAGEDRDARLLDGDGEVGVGSGPWGSAAAGGTAWARRRATRRRTGPGRPGSETGSGAPATGRPRRPRPGTRDDEADAPPPLASAPRALVMVRRSP